MKHRLKWHRRAARVSTLALATALAAGGCGNLTVGGFGEVTVAVASDASEPAPGPSAAPRMALLESVPSTSPARSSHEVEGHVEADFMLFLVSEGGAPLRLGTDMIEVRVELGALGELDAVDAQPVPATRYRELQIVFTDIRAEVQGLVVGGVEVPEVRVELDDVSLLVTRPINVDVPDGGAVELLVDLNALAWIQAVDPVLLTVDEQVFADLVSVVVR